MRIATFPSTVCLIAALGSGQVAAADPPAARPRASVVRDFKAGTESRGIARAPPRPLRLRVVDLWRYDPSSQRWLRVPFPSAERAVGQGVVTKFPERIGLYWVRWTENGVAFESKVFVGRVLCNDVMLPPPSRPDVIRTCVPLPNGAMAGYVPDPRIHARDAPAERR